MLPPWSCSYSSLFCISSRLLTPPDQLYQVRAAACSALLLGSCSSLLCSTIRFMRKPGLLYYQVHAATCSAPLSGSCRGLFCCTIRFMQQPVLLYYQVHGAACSALLSGSCSSLFCCVLSGSCSSLLCSDSRSSLFCTTMRFMQQPVLLYHPLMYQPALLHSRVTEGAILLYHQVHAITCSAILLGSCHPLAM